MASWLVFFSMDQAVLICVLAGDIVTHMLICDSYAIVLMGRFFITVLWLISGSHYVYEFFYLQGHIGGRVTLFQTTLPNIGPGELKKREDGQKSSPKVSTVRGKQNNISRQAGLFKHCFCYFYIHPALFLPLLNRGFERYGTLR